MAITPGAIASLPLEPEIVGQMFDNEYDLAMTVIEGMESLSQAGDYTLKRFKFNCA